MKFLGSIFLAAVILTGCTTVIPMTPQPSRFGYNRDLGAFGENGMPIPPRPPVALFSGAMGVQAPFGDNVFKIRVTNNVARYGEQPLVVTRLWVAGVEKPMLKMVKTFDHVFPMTHLPYHMTEVIRLPSCQFLDGSGACEVRVVAQVSSWRYDPFGRMVPSANVACIEMSGVPGDEIKLDWNHRVSSQMITCPEQSVAMK